LKDGVLEAIVDALEGIDGRPTAGYDGWGVKFATEDDKALFLLKFDWHQFA
jgi:hypothetical protein